MNNYFRGFSTEKRKKSLRNTDTDCTQEDGLNLRANTCTNNAELAAIKMYVFLHQNSVGKHIRFQSTYLNPARHYTKVNPPRGCKTRITQPVRYPLL
jgi:hypothetical protein